MLQLKKQEGFTLIEVLVAAAVFLIFALGVYGAITMVFKIVYQSRLSILENNVLAEKLEVARNLTYENIGTVDGDPVGVLPATETVTRNGIVFFVTTTVQNIDDPFDGLATDASPDTAPDDYKLVEMSIKCFTCDQNRTITVSTRVAPRRLEGGAQNGSLFIHVFDASGQDIEGASVHVANYEKDLLIDGLTDDKGMYKIINTPTGTLAYHISVTKSGYSTDYTVSPTSTDHSDSVKLPASVMEQTVTEANFSIDLLANLSLHTITPACAALGNKSLYMRGEKLKATDPSIYKFEKDFTTDGSGNYQFPNLEWDTYTASTTGHSFDVAGTVPMLPWEISPGVTQDASLILVAHSSHTLLVKARDSSTGLPLSGASAQLTGPSYDGTLITGLGFMRQTDWSGGDGQASFTNDERYWSDSGAIDTDHGDVALEKSGSHYATSGWLESSTFDIGSAVNFNNLILEPLTQPAQTGGSSLRLQIATSDVASPASWTFLGPDGTDSAYYTATNTLIYSGHNDDRYLRYKLFLSTANEHYTPEFSDFAVTFTTSCSPPGQAFFSSLSDSTYTLTVTRSGYVVNSGELEIDQNDIVEVYLSPL